MPQTRPSPKVILSARHGHFCACLRVKLPTSIRSQSVSCALPRVSAKFASVTRVSFPSADTENKELVDYIGLKLHTLRRVTRKRDPVPFLPGESHVFNHPSGEGAMMPESSALVCGQYHIETHRLCSPFGGTVGRQR